MALEELFETANKIVPFRKLMPMYIVLGIMGFITILGVILDSALPNKDFYHVTLIGRINDIHKEPKDTYFLIDHNWYLIKNECVNYMSIGDSLIKKKNSYTFTILGGIHSEQVKFQQEVKRLVFKKVQIPIRP